MIDHVEVRNFKRFHELSLRFRPMTVLSGLNGTGKSTTIQALLLARQAAEDDRSEVVQLNGPYGLALGEAQDVLYFEAEADDPKVSVVLSSSGTRYPFVFRVPGERVLHLPILDKPTSPIPQLGVTADQFVYLTAERLGPRDQLSVTSEATARVTVGEQGQYTAQTLAMHESDQVSEAMLHPRTEEDGVRTLRTQAEKWLSDIVRPIRISAQWPPNLTASIIRFSSPGSFAEEVRPANMGFGVSYALPIVVAALLLRPDGMLIVENPEAHLHPAGQSNLGRFLARLAGGGVQVIVETHSDHILNGIRLAVAQDSSVPADDVAVHFFTDDTDDPVTLELNDRGALSSWPKGFFDQFDKDLGGLARARRQQR